MSRFLPRISYSLIASLNLNIDLGDVLRRIEGIGVDMIHYDVSEEKVTLSLADLPRLRTLTRLPFDVHLAVRDPEPYLRGLAMRPEDHFCVHVENRLPLERLREIRSILGCRFGLSINTETGVEELFPLADGLDYVLFMAAKPGVSGGSFDNQVIDKIRKFKSLFPAVAVHVDGGINDVTATLVRDAGVDVLISGSYILKDADYASRVSRLVGQNLNLSVSSIMHSGSRLPTVAETASINEVANEIDRKTIGCTCVTGPAGEFIGLITDTDIRRTLILECDLSGKTARDIMNPHPLTVDPDLSLIKLVRLLEDKAKLFSVVPVVDARGICAGVVRLQDILFSNVLGLTLRGF